MVPKRGEGWNPEPGGRICLGQKEGCFCQGNRRKEERTGYGVDRFMVRRKLR